MWIQHWNIKIVITKKLRADWSLGMLAVTSSETFVFMSAVKKYKIVIFRTIILPSEPIVSWTLSIIRIKYKNMKSRCFGSWFFFRLQVKGREAPTQMGPLDRANLNHLKMEEEQSSKTSWVYIFIFYPGDGQSWEDNWFSVLYTIVRTF